MTKPGSQHLLKVVAAAVWLAGAVWCALVLRSLPAHAARWQARERELATLRELAARGAELDARVAATQSAATAAVPPAVDVVVAARLAGVRVSDTRSRTDALTDGWSMRVQELTLEDAPLAGVLAVIDELAFARPPWRLTALDVRASTYTPGSGQVAMTFETLTR